MGDRYQIVFGQRRSKAGRLLGWNTISAEIKNLGDEEMIEISLAENLSREDLSDYEKALCFRRMKVEFGRTYGEIGSLVGLSESHVCNYVRMIELFDDDTLRKHPSLITELHKISEHHARILLRVSDMNDRIQMLKLVVSENLSVRDLDRMSQRFRSWFEREKQASSKNLPLGPNHMTEKELME